MIHINYSIPNYSNGIYKEIKNWKQEAKTLIQNC
jgi:hypothetical protein